MKKQSRTIIVNSLKLTTFKLEDYSNLTIIANLKKGWDKTKILNFDLNKKDTTLKFFAIIEGKNTEKFSFKTIANHNATNTKAHFYIRSVLSDKSEIDYTGIVKIPSKAKNTDSFLSHHTLMLSKEAKTSTTPSMEIEAENAKARHQASIGKIDKNILFYMENRGINKTEGEKLLIKSFLQTDLKKHA